MTPAPQTQVVQGLEFKVYKQASPCSGLSPPLSQVHRLEPCALLVNCSGCSCQFCWTLSSPLPFFSISLHLILLHLQEHPDLWGQLYPHILLLSPHQDSGLHSPLPSGALHWTAHPTSAQHQLLTPKVALPSLLLCAQFTGICLSSLAKSSLCWVLVRSIFLAKLRPSFFHRFKCY